MLAKPTGAPGDAAAAAGADAYVQGQLLASGSGYRLNLAAFDVATDRELATVSLAFDHPDLPSSFNARALLGEHGARSERDEAARPAPPPEPTATPVPPVLSLFDLPRESGPAGITVGPGGDAWFVETNGHTIGRMTLDGAYSAYVIGRGTDPQSITTGPDGALWFTEPTPGKIGRITVAGAVTEYPLPKGTAPETIVAGADGALWFTQNGGKLGRITTAGAYNAFPLPANEPGYGLTPGPDGALWYTTAGKIGRMTAAGATTEFAFPEAGHVPGSITAGPDKALWFVDGNRIGRITLDGKISESQPVDKHVVLGGAIVAGFDGSLWFPEYIDGAQPYDGLLGRITVAGKMSAVPVGNIQAAQIGAGPDGVLWCTGIDYDPVYTTSTPYIPPSIAGIVGPYIQPTTSITSYGKGKVLRFGPPPAPPPSNVPLIGGPGGK